MPDLSEAEFKAAVRNLTNVTDEVKAFATKANRELNRLGGEAEKVPDIDARLKDVEQKLARRPGPGDRALETKSIGQRFVETEDFKAVAGSPTQRGRAGLRIETKAITSAVGSAGGIVAPDYRPEIVALPQRRLVVRDLLAPGQTSSNTVHYVLQTVRTLNAAAVAEDPSAPKPQSVIAFGPKEAPVRTIAHFMKASRQIMDDAPALASTIDSELRFGLSDQEEQQLLFGDGTGQNLLGLVPQATAFAPPAAISTIQAKTNVDVLLQAIAQAELALLPASGMVLNTIDWLKLQALKDSTNRYLSNGPFGSGQARSLWDLPVVPTMVMPAGQFLVGAFAIAAQIFDRLEAEVLLSTEDADNFQRNLVTIRAEERLALAVKRPSALIYGSFPTT